MSNVNIYEKNWINLVFEGKNQAYGAYQLRRESSLTTLFAFISGVLFISSILSLGLFLSSFSENTINCPISPISPTITLVEFKEIPVVKPIQKQAQKQAQQQKSNIKDPVDLSKMVVAPTSQALVVVPTTTTGSAEPITTTGTSGGTGLEPNTAGTTGETPINTKGNEPTPAVLLDKLPAFPGGIDKFYQYIGNNFERPALDDVTVVTVLVSFVIEIDGSITDIKILRNPGYGMDREAIRVLKSLKTKWTPGIFNGEKVRTLYTLPIKVKSE